MKTIKILTGLFFAGILSVLTANAQTNPNFANTAEPCEYGTDCRYGQRNPTGQNQVEGVSIAKDDAAPHHSAMLDVQSTTKGFLLPTMTIAERNAIKSPANGLMVFVNDTDNTKDGIYIYNANAAQDIDGWARLVLEYFAAPCQACTQ